MTGNFTTFIVDDDPSILKALSRILQGAGYDTRLYSSPKAFLKEHDPAVAGCAIIDVSMPELNGLELQEKLARQGADRQVIFLTGNGCIPMSVQAMRAGAIDFLTKPIERAALLSAVSRARERDQSVRQVRETIKVINERMFRLTPREREVMSHVIMGRLNKQIASDLGTVEKTIKVHRSRMMAKLGVRSVAELVRMTERLTTAQERLRKTDPD